MGKFTYEGNTRVDLDDRILAHVQVVVGNKLKRGEPFYFSWKDDLSTGGGRTSVWLHPRAAIVFKFHGGRTPSINRAWLDALMQTANSPSGLYIVPEPAEDTPTDPLI